MKFNYPVILIICCTMCTPLSVRQSRAEPNTAVSLQKQGNRYLSRDDYGNAAKAFEQAVKINPDDTEGLTGLGHAYLKLGANEVMTNPQMLEKSVEALSTALRINPGLVDARRDLGLAWLALGNREKALQEKHLLEKDSPGMATELAAAIAGTRTSPVYHELGGENGATSGGLTRVRIVRNSVLVPVTFVNGGQSVQATMVLDTGAAITFIQPHLAARLGMRLDHAPVVKSFVADGAAAENKLARVDQIEVGPNKKYGMIVAVTKPRGSHFPYDGLLGMNFLRDLRYHIDFEHQVIDWGP